MNANDDDLRTTLPILQTIGERGDITQRNLAKRLGLALGLTNAYLKHCINKGFVKIEQIPSNRYFYYLTPKGFAEKSRLTAQYLNRSLYFYRKASKSCLKIIQECRHLGYHQLVLCGVSDLAEILLLHAGQERVKVVAIFDPDYSTEIYMDRLVLKQLKDLSNETGYVLTSLNPPDRLLAEILSIIDKQRVLIPDIIHW